VSIFLENVFIVNVILVINKDLQTLFLILFTW